ncbi:hypothetical protein LTR37_015436 [Vermiconidia calcicola]|uniref:Uncharacterized protein n=1 Tax=Vermiconidia calcicola TaxID=1690605 RepID=A0ACC3MQS2_9PEZI|nr:hypothetical protein LTR37_015436 [Vermiconidia calcicola]
MAYLYRGPQPPRDEPQYSNFSANPLSPHRNPNRLSGGMTSNNDVRGNLTRRFTTNALPTLSPMGQQRRQAAGDTQMVSEYLPLAMHSRQQIAAGENIGTRDCLATIGRLHLGHEVSPGQMGVPGGGSATEVEARAAPWHRRGKTCAGAIGDGRPIRIDEVQRPGITNEEDSHYYEAPTIDDSLIYQHWLTQGVKPNGGYSRVTPSDRRIKHIETLLEQQRRITAELEAVDDETRREVEEGLRHERTITQMIAQSEPTTPPDYQDSFTSSVSRPNRYSTNSLTSPIGVTTRPNRSSTQLTSPSAGAVRPYTASYVSNLPSQSVPGSRRQSDDEEEEDNFNYGGFDAGLRRAAANPNRRSMPTTSYLRKRNGADFSSTLGSLSTTSFLFDGDDKPSALSSKSNIQTSPPDTKTFLQMQHTADGFPKLIRREDNGEVISAPSAALDLAFGQAPNTEQQVTDRATATRHRISLPPSALSSNGNIAPLNSILANANDARSAANNRRSLEVKFTAETKRPALMATPSRGMANGASKAQSSYSTNDIPTLKSINGEGPGGVSVTSPISQASTVADVASPQQTPGPISRGISSTTNNTATNRQSQDFTGAAKSQETQPDNFTAPNGLQPGAASFGPMHSQLQSQGQPFSAQNMPSYEQQAYYNGYGLNMMANGFTNMNLGNGYGGGRPQWPTQISPYQQGGYAGYQQCSQNGQVVTGAGRQSDNPRALIQQRKGQTEDFFINTKVPELVGQIYALCKDQHGCRFLQKKIEEHDGQDIQLIFEEVKDNFTELMIDPFGNYLCQRLLEYANNEQKTALVQNAKPQMIRIALNQHGTRALQRMIEQITTPEQMQLIIDGLAEDVVLLIQDLNGNHVVQKCLNHLSSQDAQFIFDAVGTSCVTVGTHRHGCCVLQRCVDHATGLQKGALVDHIIANAHALVQDPFGNYVVQYIIDLSEPCFTEPLCRSFLGNISYLSKQKFSSNVIEKCIRCSGPETKRLMICEIITPNELERLLRDSFANYVVQTALDFSDDDTKAVMIEHLRPILPQIRHTPYGRRIASKIQDWDGNDGGLPPSFRNARASADAHTSGGPVSGVNQTNGYSWPAPVPRRGNRMGMIGAPAAWPGPVNGYVNLAAVDIYAGSNIVSPAPQRTQDFNFMNGGMNGGMNGNNANGNTNGGPNGVNGGGNYQNNGYGGQGPRGPPYNQF